MTRALYRSRQVLHALRPRLDAEHLRWAHDLLSEGEQRLFTSMHKRDQRHAIEVARKLRIQGLDHRDLLAAALLHDCGKGHAPVWLRITNVLAPRLVRRVAAQEANGWRGAAHRLAHHVELSAMAALEAGASLTTVRLVRGHPEPHEASLLSLLTAADDAS
ncbi:MAG TPA: HD domain-containing protein [Dehalococcoidia bacterium]|nr:HD domain-containing protein [Dehalococcoidia bacterium]